MLFRDLNDEEEGLMYAPEFSLWGLKLILFGYVAYIDVKNSSYM